MYEVSKGDTRSSEIMGHVMVSQGFCLAFRMFRRDYGRGMDGKII